MNRDKGKSNPVRIGVLSCANIAVRSMIPAMVRHPLCKLMVVASRDGEKAKAIASQFDCGSYGSYDELINDTSVDALYVPLPTGLHEEWILKALAAGKHVLTEKSLAVDLSSANRMIDSARERKLVLMEDFMYRYHSQHKKVFDLLQEGFIGEMRLMRSVFGFPPLPFDNFRYNKELGGGAILDAAAYTVDASRWFLGNELELLEAHISVSKKYDVCLYGSATLHNPHTGLASQIAFGFDNFYQCNYELWGSKGRIVAERAFTPRFDFNPVLRMERHGEMESLTLPADDHFYNILTEFFNSIQNCDHEKHYAGLLHQSKLLTEIQHAATVHYI
jgi:predicted dehydrogenase